MPESPIPVINDPYVGKVYGNILDNYDNPSYNLRLYMVRPEFADATTEEDFYIENRLAPPADTVILAQTGVTGTQIDDVEIESLVTPGSAAQQTVKFNIIQPGAATFLDEIQLAKGYLGYETNSTDNTMFLEIRFQGYEADFEDNEEGGAPVVILGPLIYKIQFQSFDVSFDEAGSSYACEAIIEHTYALRDNIYRTPQTITTTGSTIQEHVDDFQAALNEWQSSTTAHEQPDVVTIDTSELIGTSSTGTNSLDIIQDQSLLTSKQAGQAETVNRIMNETFEIRTKLEQQEALAAAPTDSGTAPEVIFDGDNLSIKEGTTIEEFMYILLSMCPEFYSKVSRKEDIDDPESKVKLDQAFVSWFKMKTKVRNGPFDPSRNKYSKEYIFVPILYQTADPNIALDIKELNPEVADIKRRVAQYKDKGSLYKAYSYIFTGVNDQIISLDLSFNGGTASMLPPKYGALGEISQTSQNKFTDSTPEGEDTSFAGRLDSLLGKAKEKAEKNVFGDFIDEINNLQEGAEELLGTVANQLGGVLGLTESEILTKIQDKTQLNSLVESLDAETRGLLGGFGIGNAGPQTEPPEVTTPGPTGGTYTPELSGYVYAADFIVPASDQELDASTLAELGYVEVGKVPPVRQTAEAAKDVKSEAEAGTTQIGTTRNKLFGFITEQHNAGVYLIEIDIELRGDPWYLSAADLSEPTPQTSNFSVNDSLFFLRIASPQKYDPDYRDEDNNTGYYKYDGTSRTFSGLYRMISVVNKFSGGIFTTMLNANRVSALDEPVDTAEGEADE